jgi:hypothetical protein
VVGREVTHRVGGAGIAGECQGLAAAAAAAEIQLATRAACARLLIPAETRRRRGPEPITTGSDYGFRDRGHAAKLAQAAYTCLRCPRPGTTSQNLCGLLSQLQEFFVGQAAQQRADVRKNFLARRRVALREIVDELAERDLAGAALDDFGRDRVRLEDPFGREQNPSALRLVVNEAYATRQPWPRLGGDEGAWIAQEVLQSFGTKAPGGICFGAT